MSFDILYIGMACDILTSLLFDFDKLYVIDLVDETYTYDKKCSSVWESNKKEIKKVLLDGNNSNTFDYKMELSQQGLEPVYLKEPSKIVFEEDKDNVWRLHFKYDGKVRQIIYYHHKDAFDKWPREINNISDVIIKGSLCWEDFLSPKMDKPLFEADVKWEDYVNNFYNKTFSQMIEERTTDKFILYANSFSHLHYEDTIELDYEVNDDLSYVLIDKSDEKWRNSIIPPEIILSQRDSLNIVLNKLITKGLVNNNQIFDIYQKYDNSTDNNKQNIFNLYKNMVN